MRFVVVVALRHQQKNTRESEHYGLRPRIHRWPKWEGEIGAP